MNPEVLKGHLDSILLSALESQPLHGYAIMETLRARSRASFDLPTGTVYPALHRLERQGLINSDWSTVSGRRRRTYRLTDAGRRQLQEERASWRQFSRTVSSLLGGAPANATHERPRREHRVVPTGGRRASAGTGQTPRSDPR